MKRYSLWVKCLTFFLAVVTALGVAVSTLGIFVAGSMDMYNTDDYAEWIHGRYSNLAMEVADHVMMDYGREKSDCPEWILDQQGYLYAIKRVEGWYDLSASDWCYTIQKDAKIVRSTYTDDFKENVVHFAYSLDMQYPMVGAIEDYTEYFHETVIDEPIPVHYKQESGYQVDVWFSRNHTSYYVSNGLSQSVVQWLFEARYILEILGVYPPSVNLF